MPQAAHTLTLLPGQVRLLNAAGGLRLEVHSGCLWLTRPGDAADHFLVAGDSLELQENLVLIQSDRHPGCSSLPAARFQLAPLRPAASSLHALGAACLRALRSKLARAGLRAPAARSRWL
jgi:hypothetical protein